MNNRRNCVCGHDKFIATEISYLVGNFDERGVLILESSDDGEGITKVACEKCGEGIVDDVEIDLA